MITRFGHAARAAESSTHAPLDEVDAMMDACADSMLSLKLKNKQSPQKHHQAHNDYNFSISSEQFYGKSTLSGKRAAFLADQSGPQQSLHHMVTRSSPRKNNAVSGDCDEDDDDFELDSKSSEEDDNSVTSSNEIPDTASPSKDTLLCELKQLNADSNNFLPEGRQLHDDASDYNPSEDETRYAHYEIPNFKVGSAKWRPKLNWRANLLAANCYQQAGTEKYETVAQLFKFRKSENRWINKGPVLLILLSNEFRVVAHYLYGTHDVALNIPMWEFWSLHFRPSAHCPDRTFLLNSYGNNARTKVEFVPHLVKLAQTLTSPLTRALSGEILNSDVVYLENRLYAEKEPNSTTFALRFDSEASRNNLLATINEMVIRLRRSDREKRSSTFLQKQHVHVDCELPQFAMLQKYFESCDIEFPLVTCRGFIEALASCGFVYRPSVKAGADDTGDRVLQSLELRIVRDNAVCVYCGAELEGFGPYMGTHCGTRQGTNFSAFKSSPAAPEKGWVNPKYIEVDPQEFHTFLPQIQQAHKHKALSMGRPCPYAEAIEHYLSDGTTIQDPSLPQILKAPSE